MATELIKGKSIDDALKLTNKAVVEALDGLPEVKLHCSVLAEQAVKAALSDYYQKQGIDPVPIVGTLKEVDHEH
jgi:nitrogen fixation NifU-like protein